MNRPVAGDGTPDSSAIPGYRLAGEVDGQPLAFVLRPGENTVGALAENEIVINAAGVSRRHAIIRCGPDGVTVTDRGSKNGTLVNGVRVEEAVVQPGDLICFGPAVLRLEAVESGDDALAAAPAKAANGRPTRASRKAVTPTADGTNVSERWFGALDRVADILAANDEAGIAQALEVLISAVGAAGAGLLEWDQAGDVCVVRHTAGDFRPPANLDLLLRQAAALQPGRERPLAVKSHLVESDPPMAVAVAGDGEPRFTAVAVLGGFAQRKVCGRFLESFLKSVLRSLPQATPAGPARVRRPIRDLVFPAGYVVGRSEPMTSVFHQLRHLLGGDLPILITGETGVGKEFIAQILHVSSPRGSGPFVAVNCAALPAELLEAELFGIEAGVATGVAQRDGKMKLANGGVIFLDEIGDMSPALQAKLLRALQEKEISPVGARRPVSLDVRVVAATNTDLRERIGEGRFRSDLYYRIAGYTLNVPPLRERRGDIAALVESMIRRFSIEVDKPVPGISIKALRALAEAPWPGNVRELEHEVRRLVYLCPPGQPITVAMVSPGVLTPGPPPDATPVDADADLTLARHADELERRLITLALARARGKRAAAARLLGISRYGLALKMQRLGLGG